MALFRIKQVFEGFNSIFRNFFLLEVTDASATGQAVPTNPLIKNLLVPKSSDNIRWSSIPCPLENPNFSIVSTSEISEIEQLGALGFSLGKD